MDLFELLQRGYFPKELPPAFNTYKFALKGGDLLALLNDMEANPQNYVTQLLGEIEQDYNQRKNAFKKKYGETASAPARYSIEKSEVSRRTIHIPNPLNYLRLADLIVNNETVIFGNIPSSPYSISKAYYESDISERCILPRGITLHALQREKLKVSMSKRYEVKIDVANFYPTIYTHSITWALLGRSKAKAIWNMNHTQRSSYSPISDIQLYDMGDHIDIALRNCNERQTHGILVGPDVSFLIGELIMSRIDMGLSVQYPHLKGFRYYDDYTFYVDTIEEADAIYKSLQAELRLFGLEINEAKYEKRKSPTSIYEEHVREINPVRINKDHSKQLEGILRLFDIMWKCAELKPEKSLSIFKYGLRLLINRRIKIDSANKGLYEPLLYKTAVLKPTILPLICKILDFSVEQPTKNLLKETVDAIFTTHIPYAQDNEVAWALWICKKYNIAIEKAVACDILKMDSTICTIILLDILHHQLNQILAETDVQDYINKIAGSLNVNSLYSESWLLMYEASEHGWIDNTAIITADPFFKKLHDEHVTFYDENIAVDYTSYDYIESLPYDYYPPATKKNANTLKGKILNKIKKEAFDKYYDDDLETGLSEDELRGLIDSEIEEHDFEEELFNRILNPVFREEDVNEEELVNEFLERIELYMEY